MILPQILFLGLYVVLWKHVFFVNTSMQWICMSKLFLCFRTSGHVMWYLILMQNGFFASYVLCLLFSIWCVGMSRLVAPYIARTLNHTALAIIYPVVARALFLPLRALNEFINCFFFCFALFPICARLVFERRVFDMGLRFRTSWNKGARENLILLLYSM